MNFGLLQSVRFGVATLLLSSLCACVTPTKPLYYWGNYQPQVYAYFKGDGESPEAQLSKLEMNAQQAQARGEALPPGFNAHLGLLYLKAGQAGKARSAWLTEKAQFPESAAYMDFLLNKLQQNAQQNKVKS